MILTYRQPAPVGTRYAPTAFDRALGSPVELRGLDQPIEGRLVSAEVVDDGAAAILELDFPELEVSP